MYKIEINTGRGWREYLRVKNLEVKKYQAGFVYLIMYVDGGREFVKGCNCNILKYTEK